MAWILVRTYLQVIVDTVQIVGWTRDDEPRLKTSSYCLCVALHDGVMQSDVAFYYGFVISWKE